MGAAVKVAQAFKLVMESIFGKYKGGASGVAFDASMMEDSSTYANDLADGANDAADGLGDADSAAKKLKKDLAVLPFDELNQLSKDTKTTDESVGDATTGLGGYDDALLGSLDFGDAERSLTKFEKFAQEWGTRMQELFKAKKWKELGKELARGLNKGLQDLYDLLNVEKAKKKIFPWIDGFTTTFNSLIDNLDFELLGRDIGEGINIIVSSVNRLLDPQTGVNWKRLGQQLGNGANGLVSEINWNEIGDFFANKLNMLWGIAYGFVTTFKWGELGNNLALGVNEFLSHIDYATIADTVSTGLNGITDAVTNFINGFEADKFGANLGDAFARMITNVDWMNIGTALSDLWNKAWEFLKSFVQSLGYKEGGLGVQDVINEKLALKNNKSIKASKSTGTGLGHAIKGVIESAIAGIKVSDMATTLSTLVNKIAEDIKDIFGQTTTWYGLGLKIGEGIYKTLDGIDIDELANAINAFTDAMVLLIGGALDYLAKHQDEIIGKFASFLSKINWGNIIKLAWPLMAAKFVFGIGGLTLTALRYALTAKLVSLFSGLGVTGAVAAFTGKIKSVFTAVGSKAGTILSGLGRTLTSKMSVLCGTVVDVGESALSKAATLFKGVADAIGAPTIEGSLICAAVMGAKALQDLTDSMRGGNGFSTSGGTAIQNYIDKLTEMNTVTNDASQELFLLKESWENGEIDDNTFFGRFAEILSDAGVSAETAQQRLEELKGEVGNFSDDAVGTLESAISGLATTSENTEIALQKIGKTGEEAYNGIREAISELETTTDGMITGGQVEVLMNSFWEGGNTAEGALKSVINTMVSLGWNVDDLRNAIDEKLGKGAFDSLTGSATTASDAIGNIGTTAETTKDHVTTMTSEMSKSKETVDSWSSAAESAANNTNAYNDASKETPSIWDSVKTILSGVATTLLGSFGSKDSYKEKTTAITNSAKEGISENADGLFAPIMNQTNTAVKDLNESAKDFKGAGENNIKGYAKGMLDKLNTVTDALTKIDDAGISTVKKNTEQASPSKVYEELGNNITLGFAKGIEGKTGDVELAISSICSAMDTKFNSEKISLESTVKSLGEGLATSFGNSFSTQLSTYDFSSVISSALSGVYTTLDNAKSNFYNYGQDLASAIKNGLNSIYIPSLTVDESWRTIYYPNGSSINFLSGLSPRWYAKGALFTRATLAGLGEAGDEAALPLENKRTMSKIANAITENMDGVGIDERKLANAIAQGYVQAMMSNQQEKRDPVFNITVMTEDNEVLARAVQRGTRSLNYRNNKQGVIY